MTPGGVAVPDTAMSRPVLLRQSREAAGLHIAALAAALKVPVKKLEALEAGRYDELPDMTFARALASSACRQLKIDPAPVLEQIPLGHLPQLGDSAQSINAPFKHAQDPAPQNPMGWLSRPAVLGAIALLMGALVLVFMPNIGTTPLVEAVMPPGGARVESSTVIESPPGPVSAAAPEQPVVAATAATNAAPNTVPDALPGAAPGALAVTSALSEPTATTAGAPSENASPVPTPTPGTLLSIAATGDSWVEVVNGSGRVVMQRMLKTGDLIEFSTAPPYAVVLGRADAARVTVRGQPFDVMPYARNSVARFEVK
jgi:cytoskeleton protein RodZ